MLKVGTLFSGGLASVEFALRYEELEHEIIFACEWDKFARKQYEHFHRLPTSCFYEDVSFMDGTPYRDTLDLMVWGSPCQDLSLAGKRKGFDGAKSSLFREGARIMSEVMPKSFIFENVKGLLSSNCGADYKEVIKTFQDMGYLIAMKVMNTKDYGVPQNRERVFIVGFLDVDAYRSFGFEDGFELETRLKHYLDEKVDEKYYLSNKFIEGSIAHKERHEERGNGFAFEPKSEDDIASCLSTKYGNRQTDTYLQEPMIFDHQGRLKKWDKPELINFCPTLRAQSHGNEPCVVEPLILDDYNSKIKYDGIACTLTQNCGAMARRNGLKILEPTIQVIGNTGGGNEMNSRIYSTDGLAPTLNAGSGGGGQSPVKHLTSDYRIRKLTPKECFKLQGVKESCIDLVVSDSQAYKIAGNAISVNVMQSLLRSLYKPVSKKDTLF